MRVFRAVLTLVGAPLLASLAGCCTDPVNGTPYLCFSDVSNHDEADIGARYAPSFVAQSGGRYPDPELKKYLDDIVIEKMAKHSHRPDLPWTFEILNTSQINAFALPGGKVFVTRGLIARLETEAQFAHLMGHELGHVCHRHALRGQGKNALLGILVGTVGIAEQGAQVLIGNPDDALIVTGTVGTMGSLAFLKFNRDQELESDQRGVDYAVLAGFDPREGTKTFDMFLEMKKEAGQSENLITGLLSTHPLDTKRVRAIDRYIANKYPDIATGERQLTVSEGDWTEHLERVQRVQAQYDRYDEALKLLQRSGSESDISFLAQAKSLLEGVMVELPGHAPPRVGLALVESEQKNHEAARRHIDRAIELDGWLFEARYFSGLLHQERGDHQKALHDLLKAYDIYPASPFPCFKLGESTEALERWTSAVDWYDRALRRSPKGSEVRKRSRERLNVVMAELKKQQQKKNT